MTRRRSFIASLLFGGAAAGCGAGNEAAPRRSGAATGAVEPAVALKTLRYAFPVAETGFDPARVDDLYSRIITAHVFEAPYRYDYLARPSKIVADTAIALPEIADDYKRWTIRIRPGIHFADDAAFGGRPRELTAADYVYTWKRFFDPATRSPAYAGFRDEGVIGVEALRQQALETRRPFDYDLEVEGIRALDRYTLQFRLETPRPRFLYTLADGSLYGAIAREVVEHYRERIAEHPVGTGPFRLDEWRRSSRLVLGRNPRYREVRYEAAPAADDTEGQALLRRFAGKRLPLIDRVEIAIIEESQPRWLSFVNGEFDLISVPLEFALQAVPGGELAPYLARRGIGMQRFAAPDRTLYYFNMQDPVVGGMATEQVALRRAISLATDVQQEIRGVRRGQAIAAQSLVAPGTYGYDPDYRSLNSAYSVPRAKALLDLYGYVDRNGDGWRELPDGRPLVLRYASQPDALSRQFDEGWKKNMDAIGIRLAINVAQWPEQLKAAHAGQLMIWQLGFSASSPDVQDALQMLYGPAAGGANLSRFENARFDAIYREMQRLPDGPERLALLSEANDIMVAYAPQKVLVHRIVTWLTQPRLIGYRAPLFNLQFWQYVDIDDSRRAVA